MPDRDKYKRYLIPRVEDSNSYAIPVRPTRDPYSGRHDRGYGQGFPSVPGGTAEYRGGRLETARETLDREVGQELPGYEVSHVHPAPVTDRHSHRGRTTHYETYAGSVRPSRSVAAPRPGEDPRSFRETERVVSVDPSRLGVTNDATDFQIRSALARDVGSTTEPWRQTRPQREQFRHYTADDNYPMRHLTEDMRSRLPSQPRENSSLLSQAARMRDPRGTTYSSGARERVPSPEPYRGHYSQSQQSSRRRLGGSSGGGAR